jgi:hypothetical protein
MAPRRSYPRSTVRRILKAHSGKNLSKDADVLVYLDYVLFLRALVSEAELQARVSGDKRGVTAGSVRKVSGDVLRRFRG